MLLASLIVGRAEEQGLFAVSPVLPLQPAQLGHFVDSYGKKDDICRKKNHFLFGKALDQLVNFCTLSLKNNKQLMQKRTWRVPVLVCVCGTSWG
ncbi:MAG: hypothetical protein NZ703_07520 [Gemmataceae bacterium]|nr:hypothetical protein [Gemmataceae bacterium]